MSDRLIDIKAVKAKVGFGITKIYGLVKSDPDFPKPIKQGSSTRWSEKEIDGYVEKLKESRAA